MATAVEPILASALWTSHLATQDVTEAHNPLPEKLPSRLEDVDRILDGGLSYGSITCISAEPSSSANEISLGTIVAHLLAAPFNTATLIDSTLSFDIRKLHKSLKAGLIAQGTSNADELSIAALDRLRIMKIFDFEGMLESVNEVRTELEARPRPTEPNNPPPGPRGTIGDSQEEEDEEEMLLDPSPPAPNTTTSTTTNSPPPRSLLIIDTISFPLTPLLKTSPTQTHSLLTSFMRTLRHLTSTHSLATLLMNNAATYTQNIKEDPPSIFTSCGLRPALGKSFAGMLDLHLLVHAAPEGAGDAKAIHGGEGMGTGRGVRVRRVDVVEVVSDRFGRRVGRWGVVGAGG